MKKLLLFIVASCVLIGCTSDDGPEPQNYTSTGWVALWGWDSGELVVAPWNHGRVAHFDGASWTLSQDDRSFFAYIDIWGQQPGLLFAGGIGRGPANIYTIDSSGWTIQDTPKKNGVVWAVWGESVSQVFASEDTGKIFEYDGSGWSTAAEFGQTVFDLHGSSTSCVYGVGQNGICVNFDGTEWREIDLPIDSSLWGVYVFSDSSVVAVGNGGVITRFVENEWVVDDSGTENDLVNVWGLSRDNIFAVGEGGVVLHFDGTQWLPFESPGTAYLQDIWGRSASDIWVVGIATDPSNQESLIYNYNGTEWIGAQLGKKNISSSIVGPN